MEKTILTQSGAQVQSDLNFNEGLFPQFSAASTYAVGDLVRYGDSAYRCHTAVSVAGAWTGNTNWAATDVPGAINSAILGVINGEY